MKVYISGPIAGRHDGNRIAFEEAERFLRNRGHEPVNPHTVPHEHDGECHGKPTGREDDPHRYGCYLLSDLVALAPCDVILMLPDWRLSPGARTEHAYAEAAGIEVWHG